MRLFFALIILVLAGCASHPAASRSTFVYPPAPDAPQVIDVTWPDLMVIIRSGHVTLVREARSLQVSVFTDDGRTYRTSEPELHAIHDAIQQHAPNLRNIDFEAE